MSQAGIFELGNPGVLDVQTLTGDDLVVVPPNGAGNINIFGEDDLVFVDNSAANTLTINLTTMAKSTAQTVDATITTLYPLTVGINEVISMFAIVTGAKADYSASIFGTANGAARNVGAGAVLVGVPLTPQDNDSGGAPLIIIDVSGNDLRLRVQGEAATTYNWSAIIQFDTITI